MYTFTFFPGCRSDRFADFLELVLYNPRQWTAEISDGYSVADAYAE